MKKAVPIELIDSSPRDVLSKFFTGLNCHENKEATTLEDRMDREDDLTPELDWGIISDLLGGVSLVVLLLAALAAPGLL